MSFARYMIGLNEQEVVENDELLEASEMFPEDMSGFYEADEFGVDKVEQPSSEGLDAAVSAADQFAVASDGEDTDVDLSFHTTWPEDDSGFEKDANLDEACGDCEEVVVAAETIPAVNAEEDQFTDPAEVNVAAVVDGEASPASLAADDAIDNLGESATGWDDLF